MMPSDPIISHKVSKRQLRETWNDPGFQAELLRRCTQRILVRDELAPDDAEQQDGALSQVYDLWDNDAQQYLGTFHRYLNPDGSIGASGKPDPIWLLVGDVYHYDP